jgi:hypothetical protein
VDRTTGLLTLIPISGKTLSDTDEVWVSVNDTVVTLTGKTDVTLKDLTVAYARASGVVVSGGSGILLDNLTVHNIGGTAIDVTGSDHTVRGCTISYTGMGALSVGGGDLKTLTGSANMISGNSMTKFAQCKRTYEPGLGWSGVGHSIINNNISDAPHCGILGGGNDMLFEGNTLDHLGYEVDDSGAFYTGRQWQERGNVVRGNTFSNIRAQVPTYLGYPSVQGLYLDDQMSGYTIYNNTFKAVQTGIMIGGGRRNHVKWNHFEDCDTGIEFDNRGKDYTGKAVSAATMRVAVSERIHNSCAPMWSCMLLGLRRLGDHSGGSARS